MISRFYESRDQDKLVKIINLVCTECEWMSTNRFIPTVQWLHSFSILDCLAHALFVVEENDEIIGWCRIFPENCYTSSSIGELGIGLLPDYRNQNRGHKMLETAFSWALKQGVKQINLTVNEKNEIAIHIFNNFGFKVFAKEDDIYFMSSKI